MTNKVKPFYIKITDDMTPQMVQDAFDKCVDAGVAANDCIENAAKKNDGWYYHGSLFDWKMFGVCEKDGTCLADDESSLSGNPQEITLDQLDEWLGLEIEQEWDGNGLPPVGAECEILDINGDKIIGNGTVYHVDGNKFFILSKSLKDYPEESTVSMFDGAMNLYVMWVNDGDNRFRKPETPEQKAERERDEAIKTIQRDMAFSGSDYHAAKRLYEKGYRKQ
jgi:hypothetical protein